MIEMNYYRVLKNGKKFNFADHSISATRSENIDALEKKLLNFFRGLFPGEQITDRSERFQVAELIREKLIRGTGQEIPYCTMVEIEEFKEEKNILHIHAIIWVEREGQKAIVIGHQGERLKKIGTQARKDIEILLAKKVFLRLWVKVKAHWTDDEKMIAAGM